MCVYVQPLPMRPIPGGVSETLSLPSAIYGSIEGPEPGVPNMLSQNGWFTMEIPTNMDYLGTKLGKLRVIRNLGITVDGYKILHHIG